MNKNIITCPENRHFLVCMGSYPEKWDEYKLGSNEGSIFELPLDIWMVKK